MEIKKHPLGVLPSGNALLDDGYDRQKYMGQLGLLPDELLVVVLQDLDERSLLAVGHTCKALYAYAHFDELWKQIVYTRKINWRGTWRKTALGIDSDADTVVDATGRVYSDFLFRPFELSQLDYTHLIKNVGHQIERFDEAEMTPAKFLECHKRPFIAKLTKPIAGWTIDSLVAKFGDELFRQEYMDWSLRTYVDYMRCNADETPLYLFDCTSAAHAALNFEVPLDNLFGPACDYFELLGAERPDHQWLIIGPERSGSTFHKDPNGTSAWNSVVTGKKYWIMFPPKTPPPGVWTDADQSEVTAPVSLAEWFAGGFYEEALHSPGFCHAITEPGECMYVPSGWWHAVVNLTESIAMTGNFVPKPQVGRVLEFLRTKRDQVSGFKDPDGVYERFYELVKQKDASLVDRKRKWTEVVEAPTFTFGF